MSDPLRAAVAEIERYVAVSGWDQPARLFALVDTAELAAHEPVLAERLGLTSPSPAPPETATLTPVEQDDLGDGQLDELLAHIAWPDAVLGAAVVHEVLVLPPAAEASTPDHEDDEAAVAWAATHPERREVRLAVAVLRDGSRAATLRLRPEAADPDAPEDLLVGDDLAPGLAAALLATFRED